MTTKYLEFPAVCATHKNGRQIFSFPIDGVKISKIAKVNQYKREDGEEGEWFQRQEVKPHIKTITEYVEQEDAMIANAIVIAFDESVEYTKEDDLRGMLKVPVLDDDDRPGLIIDGQQRTRAIEAAFSASGGRVGTFPMIVCAYIETDKSALTEQFIRLNQSRNLPAPLIAELLPGSGMSGGKFDALKFGSILVLKLEEEDSPFYQLIKSAGRKGGKIARNSIINPYKKMYDDPSSFIGSKVNEGQFIGDMDELATDVKNYWIAVEDVFSSSWIPDMKKSRIMHGCALYALAFLHNSIINGNNGRFMSLEGYKEELKVVQPHCHWTAEDGDWKNMRLFDPAGDERWDFFENTEKSKKLLTSYIIRNYRENRYG